jgi:hypothetical protein
MRARNIKPSFFKNPDLGECSPQARLGFIGLWCLADREGRVLDRAKLVKAELFPYDNIDTEAILAELAECGLIKRYEAGGQKIIWIVNFAKHQSPHFKEKPSDLPAFIESPEQAPTQVGASTDPGKCQHPLNSDSGYLNPDCGILKEDITAKPSVGTKSKASGDIKPIDGVDPSAWADWIGVRKKKKAGPITGSVVAILTRESEKAGITVNEAVLTCAGRGWQNFNADWVDGGKPDKPEQPKSRVGRPPTPAHDYDPANGTFYVRWPEKLPQGWRADQ